MKVKLTGKPTMVLNDYKKTGLYIPIGTSCTFKCVSDMVKKNIYSEDYDCHNLHLSNEKNITYSLEYIYEDIKRNPFVEAIILSGLEPFDNYEDMVTLIKGIRLRFDFDIVIYTGYTKAEISGFTQMLKKYKNIIIKYGRYIPNQKPHYDEVLGINLTSDNQYAERIS